MGVAAAETFTPGEYTGVGHGLGGDLTVKVVFDETKIRSIEMVSHSETAGICEPALEQLPIHILESQSLAVGAMSE